MRYGYYPGCSLHSTAREYDASLRAVCRRLDIELAEITGWVCCGSSATHAASKHLGVALPLHNLAEAERQGLGEVLVPCAACYSRFKLAWHEVERQPALRGEVEAILEHQFREEIGIVHPLEVLDSSSVRRQLASLGEGNLSGLKVVCYYGCLLSRPPKVTRFDSGEYPQSMDRMLGLLGASVLDWGYRTDCCGASFSLTRTDIVRRLSHDILEGAREVGADAIVVACPLCHLNLDARQRDIEKEYGVRYNLPIYYFTQLLGYAIGVPSQDLMLERHFVDPRGLLEKVGPLWSPSVR
ncbi:MAG: CoB--CoM heterodisulfide reductase iron-sulfur subunit B family protein [Chloroflexi bacterium]|nr:CoB--CoM heterodisulfide reductase iron-sulfur subunit B family protein [Chloroflexota bacterium]MCL5027068.1 CoB--CoM heterodisulfide reductase iron-sulfur subunit B family protein [Chloroflexota bacterium]